MKLPIQPVSNNPLVSQHHAALKGVANSLESAMNSPALLRLNKTSAQYAAAFAALVREFGVASASLNLDYYADAREQADITAPFREPRIEFPPQAEVDNFLADAITDPNIAQSNAVGAADMLVTTIGKNALIAAIMGDGKAKKWARVTSPGACAFCRMLATRGAVYRTDSTASFVPHPRCHCTIEAVFHPESYEPTAATRSDLALYNDSTVGSDPGERLNAFRRAVAAQNRGEAPKLVTMPTGGWPSASPARTDVAGLLGRIDDAMRPAK